MGASAGTGYRKNNFSDIKSTNKDSSLKWNEMQWKKNRWLQYPLCTKDSFWYLGRVGQNRNSWKKW